LYIPSGLGYGPNDVKNQNTGDIVIPKNSNLIFEIQLDNVQ
jgi:FKBP-type peptidyl-prolyl cis-trans isomerase